MSQYKVLEVFEVEGVMQPVDSVVELAPEVAESLVAEGKLVAVEAPAPEAPAEETTPSSEATPSESVPEGEDHTPAA